jgi:predicted exporter
VLVLNDVTAALEDADIQRVLRDLIYSRRHYRLFIMVLPHSDSAAPLSIRKTLSHFLMYKPLNNKESTAVFEELIVTEHIEAKALMRYVFDSPYAFLLADTGTGEVYKKLDRIAI